MLWKLVLLIVNVAKSALKNLEQVELLLVRLIAMLIEQREILGGLDDQSVGEQDFNSVADIDNARIINNLLVKDYLS